MTWISNRFQWQVFSAGCLVKVICLVSYSFLVLWLISVLLAAIIPCVCKHPFFLSLSNHKDVTLWWASKDEEISLRALNSWLLQCHVIYYKICLVLNHHCWYFLGINGGGGVAETAVLHIFCGQSLFFLCEVNENAASVNQYRYVLTASARSLF